MPAKGAISDVDSTPKYEIGERLMDNQGNQYVYLQGVASTVVGSVVTYDELGVTTLLAANAIGPIAVAMGICTAGLYGLYLVFGSAPAKAGTVADNGNVYATATAGTVDDAVVAGDRVKCALFRSADAAGLATMQVWFPFMDDAVAA